MKRFLIFLFCSIPFLVNANDCKPVVKEYPAPSDLSKYPLENKITPDLVIRTPYPAGIAPTITVYVYDKDKRKIITFSWNDDKSFRSLLDKSFCLDKIDASDKDSLDFKNGFIANDEVIEIRLNSSNYKVFAIVSKQENDLYKYDLYILPQTETNRVTRMVTLSRYSKNEAEQILGTLKFIGD